MLSSDEDKRSEIETQLVHGCQQGIRHSQERLYKHFYGYVMSISLRYATGKPEAQEITDDSFMKLFANIHHYDPRQSLKSWLGRIVANTAIDHYRKNKKYMAAVEIENLPLRIQETIVSALTAEDLLRMIHQLPELQRLTFNLYEIEGYTHAEIANRLGISESSSRVYLTRAKERLRQWCATLLGGGYE